MSLFELVSTCWIIGGKMIYLNSVCIDETIVGGRSYNETDVLICNCLFGRSMQYSDDGGVIYLYTGAYKLDVSYSVFYNCSSLNRGGAIYTYNLINASVTMVCAYRCFAVHGYHFARLYSSKNIVMRYLSISSCSYYPHGAYSISPTAGFQEYYENNCSLNYAMHYSDILFESPSTFASAYNSFCNNSVSEYICIFLSMIPGTIGYSNIINDLSPSYGVVYINGGNPCFDHCIFDMNKNTLFYVNSGSLSISNSFIYHSGTFSTFSPVQTNNNNSMTRIETYQMVFFASHYCHADNPIMKQTPVITIDPTPIITQSSTIIMTINESPMCSEKETPYRSYDDTIRTFVLPKSCNIKLKKEIVNIFALSFWPLSLI